MPVKLVTPPTKPEVRTKRAARRIEGDLQRIFGFSAKRRDAVTAGWENEKPTFVPVTENQGDVRISAEIRMAGPVIGRKKWIWLSFGTSVRYAQMTPDFKAKTAVGRFSSGGGRGGFSHLGAPRPGIKARQWDKISRERDKGKINDALNAFPLE